MHDVVKTAVKRLAKEMASRGRAIHAASSLPQRQCMQGLPGPQCSMSRGPRDRDNTFGSVAINSPQIRTAGRFRIWSDAPSPALPRGAWVPPSTQVRFARLPGCPPASHEMTEVRNAKPERDCLRRLQVRAPKGPHASPPLAVRRRAVGPSGGKKGLLRRRQRMQCVLSSRTDMPTHKFAREYDRGRDREKKWHMGNAAKQGGSGRRALGNVRRWEAMGGCT